MSNVTIFNGSLPAHIAARGLTQSTLNLAGNTGPSVKRISIDGGVFRAMQGSTEISKSKSREMNIVIVRTAPNNNRSYYDPSVTYVRGQSTPPACSSADGIRPDARIKEPQASTCASCPQNIAGSGNNGARACRYHRRLAVVLEGDLNGEVYQLTLPSTSIFGKGEGTKNLPLEAYARMLASNNVNIDDVVTTMEFDTDSSTPKLTFSVARFLEPAESQAVIAQGETQEAIFAVGESTPAAPAPQPIAAPASTKAPALGFESSPQAAVAQAETAIAEDGVDEPAVAEPTVAKKPEPAGRSAQISNVLAAWGD